jgi:hypothetical protein
VCAQRVAQDKKMGEELDLFDMAEAEEMGEKRYNIVMEYEGLVCPDR